MHLHAVLVYNIVYNIFAIFFRKKIVLKGYWSYYIYLHILETNDWVMFK